MVESFRTHFSSDSYVYFQEKRVSVKSLLQLLRKVTVMMYGNLLHATLKMGVIRFRVMIVITPTFQRYMMNPSESTLLSQI